MHIKNSDEKGRPLDAELQNLRNPQKRLGYDVCLLDEQHFIWKFTRTNISHNREHQGMSQVPIKRKIKVKQVVTHDWLQIFRSIGRK